MLPKLLLYTIAKSDLHKLRGTVYTSEAQYRIGFIWLERT